MKMNTPILVGTLFVSALFQVSQFPLLAIGEKVAVHAEVQPVATIKYIGIQDEFYLFQVDCKQPSEGRATLRITDGNGNEIFRTSFFEKVYSRRIKIAREGYKSLQFVLNAKNQLFTKTYAINSQLVEKVEVEEVIK